MSHVIGGSVDVNNSRRPWAPETPEAVQVRCLALEVAKRADLSPDDLARSKKFQSTLNRSEIRYSSPKNMHTRKPLKPASRLVTSIYILLTLTISVDMAFLFTVDSIDDDVTVLKMKP
uniref:SFRICE_034776 n=1 Tax=Spodoptera frugiperda TaxID=7108 RepID=A0A2H1WPE6_SPOFR